MLNFVNEGTEASPEDVGRKLWKALTSFLCEHDDCPCDECMRALWPMVRPVMKALVISGRRNGQYVLTGRAVEWLLKYAETGDEPESFNDEEEDVD